MTKQAVCIIVLLLFLSCSFAQESSESAKPKSDLKFVPVPYLNYSRNLKFEFGAVPMLMFPMSKQDTVSPPSMAGAMIVFTTNGSFFGFAFTRLFLDHDRWRISAAAGTGDQNSQTWLESIDIPPGIYDFSSTFKVVHLGVQRNIKGSWYGGLAFTHSVAETTFEDDIAAPTDNVNNALSFILTTDTRDLVWYPDSGYLAKIKLSIFPEWLANDTPATRVKAEYNRYIGMAANDDVLAVRAHLNAGLGDVDFEQQVVIGNKDIRGYSLGEFRGDGKIAVQTEYRKNFDSGLGLVGFFGLATLYGADNDDYNWKLYPGIGTGFRYTAFKKNKLKVGLDAAVGDGDWGIYFRIGEAF